MTTAMTPADVAPPATTLGLVQERTLLDGPIEVTFRLAPGDRPLVVAGEAIIGGTVIAERLRDPSIVGDHVPIAGRESPASHGGEEDADARHRSAVPIFENDAGCRFDGLSYRAGQLAWGKGLHRGHRCSRLEHRIAAADSEDGETSHREAGKVRAIAQLRPHRRYQ